MMKAKLYDQIQTLVDLQSEFKPHTILRGAIGTIVKCYAFPEEQYAVDLKISNPSLVGGSTYENVILCPDQFIVLTQPAEIAAS
jgi:hypothetical protein